MNSFYEYQAPEAAYLSMIACLAAESYRQVLVIVVLYSGQHRKPASSDAPTARSSQQSVCSKQINNQMTGLKRSVKEQSPFEQSHSELCLLVCVRNKNVYVCK